MISPARARLWVSERVGEGRLAHSDRVATLCGALARQWDANVEHAVMAGILHDCARDMRVEELKEQTAAFNIPVTDIEERFPVLLHAPVGAEMARSELGVVDAHILDAVRFHTTGRSGMSLLEKILFVADYAEPDRDFPGVEGVRALMFTDLEGALRLALDQTLTFLLGRGRLLHPRTVEARNALWM